jgi:hypothetical protein
MREKKLKVMIIAKQPSQIQIMVDQKRVENLEYFSHVGSMITNYARCTREIKSKIAMAKTAFSKKIIFTNKFDLNVRRELVKCYIRSIAFYGFKTWTLRKIYQKYLGSLAMWCWTGMEELSWTERVGNEAVLHRVKEDRNTSQTIKIRRKAD